LNEKVIHANGVKPKKDETPEDYADRVADIMAAINRRVTDDVDFTDAAKVYFGKYPQTEEQAQGQLPNFTPAGGETPTATKTEEEAMKAEYATAKKLRDTAKMVQLTIAAGLKKIKLE